MRRIPKPDCPGWWWIRDERYGGSTKVVKILWDSERVYLDMELYEELYEEPYERPDQLCWKSGDYLFYVEKEAIAWAEGPLPVPE